MGDFFHGWRRKVGCLLLAVAVALTSGWVRSLKVSEMAWCDFYGHSVMLAHGNGRLQWLRSTADPLVSFDYRWKPHADRNRIFLDNPWWKWDQYNLTVPYWSLVIPLILVSAWLILTPHRYAPKQLPIDE
jgi:hypothetical protein